MGVIEQLGGRRPVLVGASMGGGTSLVAVGEDHVDATALVLVDIAPRIEPEGVEKIKAFMNQRPDGFDSLDEVADAIASYQPHRDAAERSPGWPRTCASAPTAATTGTGTRACATSARDLGAAPAPARGLRRRLDAADAAGAGRLSDILSEEGAQRSCELCPHAEYVNVTGAGHMVAGDRNDIFANAVIEFLARTCPSAASPCNRRIRCSRTAKASPVDVNDVP